MGLFEIKKENKNAEDYFLASKSLPCIVGASLIAIISAEQFIGMSGSGFAL